MLVLFNSTSDIMLKSITSQPLGVVKLDTLPLNAVAYQLFQLPSIHHWLKSVSDIYTYFWNIRSSLAVSLYVLLLAFWLLKIHLLWTSGNPVPLRSRVLSFGRLGLSFNMEIAGAPKECMRLYYRIQIAYMKSFILGSWRLGVSPEIPSVFKVSIDFLPVM